MSQATNSTITASTEASTTYATITPTTTTSDGRNTTVATTIITTTDTGTQATTTTDAHHTTATTKCSTITSTTTSSWGEVATNIDETTPLISEGSAEAAAPLLDGAGLGGPVASCREAGAPGSTRGGRV